MASPTTIHQTTRLLLLKVLAKIFRVLIVSLARFKTHKKPTPDLIEYIPGTSTTTTTTAKTNKSTIPNSTHKIKIHIYCPKASSSSSSPPKATTLTPTPVLITACGSGFITPGLGFDDLYCRLIATNTSCTVIDVGYRLAPEHPFPCALEDVARVVNWVLAQPERFDITRIAIGGFSAGANIATAVAVNYFPPDTFYALVAFYPVFDATGRVKRAVVDGDRARERPEFGGMASVPGWLMRFMRDCYLVGGVDGDAVKDPRVSPAYADVGRFPSRCVFVTCEFDVLAREAEELAERINGCDHGDEDERKVVVVHRVKGCGHAFDKNVKVGSERERLRDEVYGLVVDMLKAA